MQKATHDFDYINYILGDVYPTTVCAVKSKQIFRGDKKAGLLCENCAEYHTCPESPENVQKLGDGWSIGKYCCFAKDTGNEDSGSALVLYNSGMHVAYSQNFIVRASAGKRGARLIGYLGTLEFDFRSGTVTLHHHMRKITETHSFASSKNAHFGGDRALAENFVCVMSGREKSKATLAQGILSAEMCLAARKSAERHEFVDITFQA